MGTIPTYGWDQNPDYKLLRHFLRAEDTLSELPPPLPDITMGSAAPSTRASSRMKSVLEPSMGKLQKSAIRSS